MAKIKENKIKENKINIVIDNETVERFGGLHVKRYDADLIVMTSIDIIRER